MSTSNLRRAAAATLLLAAAALSGCAAASRGPRARAFTAEPEDVRRFPAQDLYGYIDGGAELFLEFGFEELTVETFRLDTLEVDLETYRMESPEAALGIYLAKCGREEPCSDVPGRNTANPFQILMVAGRDFVQADNFSGEPAGFDFATALLRHRWDATILAPPTAVFDVLPREGLVEGSEALVRGQFGLQPIVTLGEGDILQLEGRIWGVVADYLRPEGGAELRIYVRYPDRIAARGALEHVAANLDSYLRVTDWRPDGFDYEDWRGWPGRLELDGRVLVVHVPSGPPADGASPEIRRR